MLWRVCLRPVGAQPRAGRHRRRGETEESLEDLPSREAGSLLKQLGS